MYVYRDFYAEYGCWTVGFYDPSGRWYPESDWNSPGKAAELVRYLNGGRNEETEQNHRLHVAI